MRADALELAEIAKSEEFLHEDRQWGPGEAARMARVVMAYTFADVDSVLGVVVIPRLEDIGIAYDARTRARFATDSIASTILE